MLKKVIFVVCMAALLGIGLFFAIAKFSKPSEIPADIMRKINFTIYYPNNEQAWMTDRSTITYDSDSGVLTMTARNDSDQIVLTQQTSPDVFKDVPQQYPRLLDALHQYAEIQTSFGTVTLTHPEELKGRQTAVANLNGTLLFAKPNRDLNEDEWKEFFASMEVIR